MADYLAYKHVVLYRHFKAYASHFVCQNSPDVVKIRKIWTREKNAVKIVKSEVHVFGFYND